MLYNLYILLIIFHRYKKSSQLVSHDPKSNIYNYKYTFSVEIPPICKEDLVCLPKKLANQLGSISQLVLVHKITNQIHLIDPFTLQSMFIIIIIIGFKCSFNNFL